MLLDYIKKVVIMCWTWCYMPVIPPAWEAETEASQDQGKTLFQSQNRKESAGEGGSSVVEHLPSIFKVLDFIYSIAKERRRKGGREI
jgi:hypothetical protein